MIPDAAERMRAVMTPGHAFVWASAGTGKTHTLTLRALHLLLQAPFDPRAKGEAALYSGGNRAARLDAARAVMRRFVLTTFTRKAAAEMQERLYRYLERLGSARGEKSLVAEVKASNKGRGDAQFLEVMGAALARVGDFAGLALGAAALAERAAELQVVTLHSYAAAILRRHPIAAGIPPSAEFAEEDDGLLPDPMERLVERWLERVLADKMLLAQFEALLPVVPLDAQRAWFAALLKDPWIADELEVTKPSRKDLDALLAFCRALVGALAPSPARYTKIHAARHDLSAKSDAAVKGASGAWLELSRSLQEHGETWFGKTTTVTKAVAALDPDGRWFGEDGARRLLVRQVLATDRAAEWKLWREHCLAFREWARDAAIRELNLVTFDEMVLRAAELLRGDPRARADERARLWALLVDEFQDTDPLQLDILRSLLRRSAGESALLGFFVGDRKQSIYRFRDADLPAIEAFVRDYPALVGVPAAEVEEVTLRASFRTLKGVLGFVNHFFGRLVPLPNYAEQQLEAVRGEKGPRVEWRTFSKGGEMTAEERRRASACEVARVIADHVRKALESDPKKPVGEVLREVLVLVPTHAEINALLPVFEEAGIPAISVGTRTFFTRPEVLDALNLLIALHDPLDTVAVAALLRSPLVGLSDPESHALLAKGGRTFHGAAPLPRELDPASAGRIEAARGLARDRLSLPLAEWLGRVRGFVPEGVYAASDGEGRAMARVERVLETFGRAVESGVLPPLAWLLEQRARANEAGRFDADLGEDVAVSDERAPAVRVMTIHKAKGLEGKFVIAFGWTKTLKKCDAPDRGDKAVVRVTGGDGKPLRGFSLGWGELEVVSDGYAAALEEDREGQREEGRRLLYVAATRAKDRLVLVSEEAVNLDKGVLAGTVPKGDLAKALDGHAMLEGFGEGEAAGAAAKRGETIRDADGYAKFWKARLAAAKEAPAPLVKRPSGPEHPEEEESLDAEDYVARKREENREAARIAGVLVHAYLERHARDEAFHAAKLGEVVGACAGEGDVEGGRDKAARILAGFYGSANHARVRVARVLGQEIPVYLRADGEAWNGVMDLVLEENGRIVGVDYKTMRPPAELREEYATQQRLYTRALGEVSGGKEVAFEFWWLAG
jgi:ATP-dependent exoDNAse (exonuclease V) beta subunit